MALHMFTGNCSCLSTFWHKQRCNSCLFNPSWCSIVTWAYPYRGNRGLPYRLCNSVEAPFKRLLNFNVCVLWWRTDGPMISQEYQSLCGYYQDMTKHHHLKNRQAYHLFYHNSLWEEMGKINPVTCLFSLLKCTFVRASFLHLSKDTNIM